jgi:hypothetical protein
MILAEISHYLQSHRRASLNDLARGLGSTPEALEMMLKTLERKGRVRRLPSGSKCASSSSCCQCDPTLITIYEWIGEEITDASIPDRP